MPPIKPHTTEYRQHAVTCPCCAHSTRATGAGIIPRSPFGPRLMALVALLSGVYHLSRRRTVQALHDILGVRISLGAVSAVEARVSDAVKHRACPNATLGTHRQQRHPALRHDQRLGRNRVQLATGSAIISVGRAADRGSCRDELPRVEQLGFLLRRERQERRGFVVRAKSSRGAVRIELPIRAILFAAAE